MKQSKYLAVFKSLSYAGRIRNEFLLSEKPEIIKTPKKIMEGCSYSLVFSENQLDFIKRLVNQQKKGFVGLYRQMESGQYEVIKQ